MESVEKKPATPLAPHPGMDALKFWLMPFVCFASFGFAVPFGTVIARLSLFAPIAFYILCGYASAVNEQEEGFYERVMKRTAVSFLLMFGAFVVFNLIFYAAYGSLSEILTYATRKRTLFNLVILCVWPFPIGETIWFLQALLYARVILWLMDKWKLMRFYKAVMVITMLLMILLGELAGLIHFNVLGYTCIPGNGLTRALPYMLFGRFLYEKRRKILAYRKWVFMLLFFLGAAAAIGEWELLGRTGYLVYTGHLIGYGIMAFSACCFFLKKKRKQTGFAVVHGRNYSHRIYALSQPVGHILLITVALAAPQFYGLLRSVLGLLVYLICFLLAYFMGFILYKKNKKKKRIQQKVQQKEA